MQKLINQIQKIEQNIKNIKDPKTLVFINKRYRDLQDKLNVVISNIDVIFENYESKSD